MEQRNEEDHYRQWNLLNSSMEFIMIFSLILMRVLGSEVPQALKRSF